MATVNIVFGTRLRQGGDTPVLIKLAQENITSSGTSAATTAAANASFASPGTVAQITVTGGNVYVDHGETPTAVAGSGYLILDGQTRDIGLNPNDKVAVIDA
jgi:hypothetical protein